MSAPEGPELRERIARELGAWAQWTAKHGSHAMVHRHAFDITLQLLDEALAALSGERTPEGRELRGGRYVPYSEADSPVAADPQLRERLYKKLSQIVEQACSWGSEHAEWTGCVRESVRAILALPELAALATPRPAATEPVAWMVERKQTGGHWRRSELLWASPGYSWNPEREEEPRVVPLYRGTPPEPGSVRVPTTEDEAALMAIMGEQWLREHAPHRLRAPPEPAAPQSEPEFCGAVSRYFPDKGSCDCEKGHTGLHQNVASEFTWNDRIAPVAPLSVSEAATKIREACRDYGAAVPPNRKELEAIIVRVQTDEVARLKIALSEIESAAAMGAMIQDPDPYLGIIRDHCRRALAASGTPTEDENGK